ncbi:MAG: iron-sulfur cluster repair di-iron protein [Bacteroidetes bacterium]|nr:iron-sulfur cluster repair di-iron protein [Bacteroidota bacterium]
MLTFSPESKVGDIAVEQPSATRSFYRFGIDFCCGGGKSLQSVCEKKGIDVSEVLRDIQIQQLGSGETSNDWKTASLAALISHIITTYHEPLRSELPRLKGMLDKVQRVHGHVDPERFEALQSVFTSLIEELSEHMLKEEQILFPMIMQGNGAHASAPISVMEQEHDNAGEALRAINKLTDEYVAPDYACNTWRALWSGFEDLEKMMHEHVHLENNILFPRALTGLN